MSTFFDRHCSNLGISLCMHPATERRRYYVTSSLIGSGHSQNDGYLSELHLTGLLSLAIQPTSANLLNWPIHQIPQCACLISRNAPHWDRNVHIPVPVFCDMVQVQCGICDVVISTHWGRDKMAAISQMTFSNAFCCMKKYEFRLTFHWSLFLWFELTIFQHWFI